MLPQDAQTSADCWYSYIEEPTVETMSQTCERYGLTASSDTIGGYTAYTYPDGTLTRFKITSALNGRTVP